MKKTILALIASAMFAVGTAHAEPADLKKVWGGGKPTSSAYSGVYVPKVIEVLEEQRLAGYAWAGVSEGTAMNAEMVTLNPTHLAVGQTDILKALQGTPIPGKEGQNYQFTFLQEKIGSECLYAVTAEKNYSTLGDIVGNSWDLTVITGGEKSGSFGTWKVLTSAFSELADVTVVHTTDNAELLNKVAGTKGTFGFFVMRPDPNSEIFKQIEEQKLTIVPVVDFALEGKYDVLDLKVAHGGILSDAKTVTTSCTSVALITGDPANASLVEPNAKKRLEATIARLKVLDDKAFVPDTSSWRDMFDSIKSATVEQTKELMDASKKKLDDLRKKGQNG